MSGLAAAPAEVPGLGETRSRTKQAAALQAGLHAAAAASGNVSVIQQLLQQGAAVNSANVDGATALHLAAASGYDKVVQVLLAAGAAVDATQHDGATPLLRAACCAAPGCADVIKQLLHAGASLNIKFSNGCSTTLLHAAASQGRLLALQALLDAGCGPDEPDMQGRTPLDYAIQHSQAKAAAKLIEAGAAWDKPQGSSICCLARAA